MGVFADWGALRLAATVTPVILALIAYVWFADASAFPLLLPALLLVAIITVAGYFQLFAEPYVMTRGDPLQSTVSVLYYMYEEGFKWWSLGRATAIAFLLFVLITQLFLKVPALHALAPNAPDNPEPPFAIAQLALLAIFVWLIWKSVKSFRGPAAA